jgi:hypothetical protein
MFMNVRHQPPTMIRHALNRSALEGKCGPAALGWPTVLLAGSYLASVRKFAAVPEILIATSAGISAGTDFCSFPPRQSTAGGTRAPRRSYSEDRRHA